MSETRSYEFRDDLPMPCMGGWCRARERCAHHHSTSKIAPAERLCVAGSDGTAKPGAQVDGGSGWVRLQRVAA